MTEEQLKEVEELYRKTDMPRYRTRAQMVLLSAENSLKAEEIALIVRESYVTVLRWLKRFMAEGIKGLKDAPRPGRSATVTEDYHKRLTEAVRRRPRSLGLAENWLKKTLCLASLHTRSAVLIPNIRSKKGDRSHPRRVEARRFFLLYGRDGRADSQA
jgi:transposase